MRRRNTLRIVIFLLIGIAANVAVAWIAAAIPHGIATSKDPIPNPKWPRTVPARWPQPQFPFSRMMESPARHTSVFVGGATGDDYREVSIEIIETGWPMKSFAAEKWSEFGVTEAGTLGLITTDHPTSIRRLGLRFSAETRLPIRPLPPGFIINTLFFSAAAATLWYTPGLIRRIRRRRRNACQSCGYSRAGLTESVPCPECGNFVEGRAP